MLTEKPAAAAAPAAQAARPARRPRHAGLPFRGSVRPARRGERQHHDPRVHVRDRRLRGHPGLLERRAGPALRAARSASTWSGSATPARSCSWTASRRWTSWPPRSSRSCAGTGSARTPTSGRSFYKSTQAIGVKLHGLEHRYYILALPFGDYVDTNVGVKIGTVSWRRTSDPAIPSRAKIVGSYVNPAFSKSEAMLNGYDEALVLSDDGHISEGSAENIFVIRDGVLATPAGLGRHPRGDHPGRDHGDLRRAAACVSWSVPSTVPRSTWPTRRSSAGRAPRSARSSRSTTGPSGRAASARSRSASRTATSRSCAATSRPIGTG